MQIRCVSFVAGLGMALSMALCVTVMSPAPAQADAPRAFRADDPAMGAYQHGDYAEAIRIWTPRANAGEPDAQYWMGQVYLQGKGVTKDVVTAMNWFRKAANQGHAYGQYFMGSMYEEGTGVAPNYANAAYWYRKACDQGHYPACQDLAGLYERGGPGLPRDDVQAFEWYEVAIMTLPSNVYTSDDLAGARNAAAARLTPAQTATATAWLKARYPDYDGPVEVSPPKAIPVEAPDLDGPALVNLNSWAQLGEAQRQAELGQAYLGYRGVTRNYPLALAWLNRSAAQDYPGAEATLGDMNRDGLGVPRDVAAAAGWYRKAADQGYGRGQFELARLYESGQGVPQDDVQAFLWYDLSTRSTDGQLFSDGDAKGRKAVAARLPADRLAQAKALSKAWKPVPLSQARQVTAAEILYNRGDYAAALAALTPLAEAGNAQAQYWLACMYDFGDGTEQNWAAAASWYRKAADQGHAGAQNALGALYEEGHGVHQDLAAAAEWVGKAADQNFGYAQARWGVMYLEGQGVEKNEGSALYLFQKAADQGNDIAMLYLAVIYYNGLAGLKADPVQAYKWAALAETYALNDDMRVQAAKYKTRVAASMSPDDIAKGKNQVVMWFPVFPAP